MTIDTDEITMILSGVKILQDLEVEIVSDIAANIEIADFRQGDMVVSQSTTRGRGKQFPVQTGGVAQSASASSSVPVPPWTLFHRDNLFNVFDSIEHSSHQNCISFCNQKYFHNNHYKYHH